eukprot:309172-Pyramimonas_sp.AAC.2
MVGDRSSKLSSVNRRSKLLFPTPGERNTHTVSVGQVRNLGGTGLLGLAPLIERTPSDEGRGRTCSRHGRHDGGLLRPAVYALRVAWAVTKTGRTPGSRAGEHGVALLSTPCRRLPPVQRAPLFWEPPNVVTTKHTSGGCDGPP